ncbi:hypothetical protein QAD02_022996 [Eretmocerus hayati]|uniref:Uncharacterized protein n=1 Tax=Eretmocerus hayati TaxID=131215 RepID=A0ACC2PUT1_9HYME|nr:hypothetical protein QAD02_022996 [Eretmocerus hayati]
MGFAAVKISTENGLEAPFHTSVPNSWLEDERDGVPGYFVHMMPGALGDEDYNLVFSLAKIHEAKDAPLSWTLTKCEPLDKFRTYDESYQFIRSKVMQGLIIEQHLGPEVIDDTLDNIIPLVPESEMDQDNHHELDAFPGSIQNSATGTITNDKQDSSLTGITSGSSQNFLDDSNVTLHIPDGDAFITREDWAGLMNIVSSLATKVTKSIEAVEKNLTIKLQGVQDRLDSLDSRLTLVQNKQIEMTNTLKTNGGLKKNESLLTFEELSNKHELKCPFETDDEYLKFDQKIISEVYEDLKKHIISTSDNHQSIRFTCSEILKKFFKGAVLNLYTAKRQSTIRTKKIFQGQKFYACLKDALTNVYYNPQREDGTKDEKVPEFSTELLITELGHVFNNANSWDGKRAERTRKSDENSLTNAGSKKQKRCVSSVNGDTADVLQNSQSQNVVQD